jgi:hypothetical protein
VFVSLGSYILAQSLTAEQKQFFIKHGNATAQEVNNFGNQLSTLLEKPTAS